MHFLYRGATHDSLETDEGSILTACSRDRQPAKRRADQRDMRKSQRAASVREIPIRRADLRAPGRRRAP